MLSKYSLFLILFAVSVKSESQTLLNKDLSVIKKEIGLQKGVLIKTALMRDGANISFKEVTFRYQTPPEGNTCIFDTKIYLTSNNKCFKYIDRYWGDELPNQKISELKKYYPGLKQIGNKSQWVDYKNKFEVSLTQDKHTSAVFYLEIKIIAD